MVIEKSKLSENNTGEKQLSEEFEKLIPRIQAGEVSVDSIIDALRYSGKFSESQISQFRNTVNEAVSREKVETEVKVEKKEAEKKIAEAAKENKKSAAKCESRISPNVPVIGIPAASSSAMIAANTRSELTELGVTLDKEGSISPRKIGVPEADELEQMLS